MAEMNMNEFNEKMQRWAAKFPVEAERALKRAAGDVRGEAVTKHLSGPTSSTTLSRRSGDLANSITTSVRRSGGRMVAEIGNLKKPLPYARIHEYGGTIRPKKGTFLKFEIGGKTIFAKEVKIPERSYLRSSLKAKRQSIVSIITRAMRESYYDA